MRRVEVDGTDVVVRLGGWDALWALKREVRIPLDAIAAVRAGRDVRRQFVSFGRRDSVLAVQADRARDAPYDVVAIELPDAERVAAAIEDARSSS